MVAATNLQSFQSHRELVCDLCRRFYQNGWVSGTGGGMTIKVDDSHILVAPSGVQKESLKPENLFLLELTFEGYKIIEKPTEYKISACTSIFINIYKQPNQANSLPGAVIHSHSINAVMLTKIVKQPQVTFSKYEMLKGLDGCTYFGEHTVPILDNVEHECDLADAVAETIAKYPQSYAVLVRDHGVYVWGKSWQQAKIHAECYDYLFEAYVKEKQLEALKLC